jgi:hypothetical protein
MFRKAHLIPFAALVLVAAAPPAAASAGNAERQTVTTTQSGGGEATTKAERKICKTIPDSARRINNKRLCMTQKQWKEFDDAMDD